MDSEILKQHEFKTHLENKTLRLAFIGMSNAGKSYQARKLRDLENFFDYSVDDEILKQLGINSMSEISTWLGYPNSPTYPERERVYLETESRCTKISHLDTHGKNLIFDTTGSVIYLENDATDWLRTQCLIVNIDVGEERLDEMLRRFIADPKPVIWNGHFKALPGETERDTITRCYPELLRERLKRYRALAHVTIPAPSLTKIMGTSTLDLICSLLPL